MTLKSVSEQMLPKIEEQLRQVVDHARIEGDDSLKEMITYHMGWSGKGAGLKARGKRIRPLLLMLSTEAVGGDADEALPAAAAVEVLHNFSLIHDDIEDDSPKRRGRETLWKLHGIPITINAGDSLFTLAFQALQGLAEFHSPEICINVYQLFTNACLTLTKGQHLDISFEHALNIQVAEYLRMIEGKTAALLSSSAEIGAILGGAAPEEQLTYRELGKYVGMAFQVHDDILGIWGNPKVTGKSASSDLIARKKSLPIIFGLEQNGRFAEMWQGVVTEENVTGIADQLRNEGGYDYAKEKADIYTTKALDALESAAPQGITGEALSELIHNLVSREY